MDDAMQSFVFDTEPLENPETSENPECPDNNNTKCFLTSLGPIPHDKVLEITKDLTNRSFTHTITGETPKLLNSSISPLTPENPIINEDTPEHTNHD